MPKQIHRYEVLRRPIVTEKSTMLAASGKYVFEVAIGANKPQIQEAVEKAFDVHVRAVNVMRVRGKTSQRRPRRQPPPPTGRRPSSRCRRASRSRSSRAS